MGNKNRTTKKMTVNEASMFMAYITSRIDQTVEPVNGNLPASMGQVYQGQQVVVSGYSTRDQANGHRNRQNWVWRVCDDVDNAETFGRQWTESMRQQGYDTEERTVWYTTMMTTPELLARWEKANEHGGPTLYWP